MDNDVAIKVNHVSKTFKLPHEKNASVKSAIVNFWRRKKGYELQEALKDVSFEVKRGEFFGIVGRNGSGKSTLLKIIAGIYSPSNGNIQTNGKLTPFIELGVGFNPELTGRENVFLNGALLGFNRKAMRAMYKDIVDFSELHRFMDQKLKNYSSGMQVRLAFSIAVQAKTDILILDEVLAVGDSAFQKKCFDYFVRLKKTNTTVIIVTHDMTAVERFCDRAVVINNGQCTATMSAIDASTQYKQLNAENYTDTPSYEAYGRWGTKEVVIDKVSLISKTKASGHNLVKQGEKLTIKIRTKAKTNKKIVAGLAFIDQFGVNVSGPNSMERAFKSNTTIEYTVDRLPLGEGKYYLTVAIFDENAVEEFDHIEQALTLDVIGDKNVYGKVNLFGSWRSSEK